MEKIKNIKLPNGEVYELGGGLDDKITSCITEIPQRIKLELNNGTLTLKAGSVVTVPNGFEADGTTPKFDYVTIESDLINTGGAGVRSFIYYDITNDMIRYRNVEASLSGTSDPANNATAYYDTSKNKLNYYTSAGLKTQASLPLAIISGTDTTATSINQVFNGFGYIGSIKWIDTGVIGLASNGKNPDGSLNNIQWERNSILLKDVGNSGSSEYIDIYTTDGLWYNTLSYSVSETEPTTKTQAYWWYNPSINEHFRSDGTNWIKMSATTIGSSSKVDGKIILFNAKQPFRAVDYNDKSEVSGWSMPSNKYIVLSKGASGTKYTAPTNGWFAIKTEVTNSTSSYKSYVEHSCGGRTQCSSYGWASSGAFMPCQRGQYITLHYENTVSVQEIRFIYAEGE